MKQFTINDAVISALSGKALILNSFYEYQKWYLSRYDFNMFSHEDIRELLQEDEPENYPCVPFLANDYADIFYFSIDLITLLNEGVQTRTQDVG